MNGIVKPLEALICCHENARFSFLLIFKNGFTIKRAERSTGNCSRSLIFRMNLWKGLLQCDMKYHILRDFRISTPFKDKSSDHFTNGHQLKLLTNFDVNLTSFLGGAINHVLNINSYLLLAMTSDRNQNLSGASVDDHL